MDANSQYLPSQISCVEAYQVKSPVLTGANALVQELFFDKKKEQNRDLVQEVFWANEAQVILSIPISTHEGKKKLFWGLIADEILQVKSTFKVTLTLKDDTIGEESDVDARVVYQK